MTGVVLFLTFSASVHSFFSFVFRLLLTPRGKSLLFILLAQVAGFKINKKKACAQNNSLYKQLIRVALNI